MRPSMQLRRTTVRIFALVLFAAGLAVAAPAYSQVHKEAIIQDIAPIVADAFRDRGDGVLWEGRVSAPRAFYIRLRFSEIISPPGAAYAVVVRKANGATLTRYSANDFARTPSFYTDPLFADDVKVQVQGASLAGVSFKIDRVLRHVEATGRLAPQSIVPEWWALNELKPGTPALRLADAVAKVYVGEGFVCTGFLIAPGVLVTNFHCLEKSFSYQSTATNDVKECNDIKFQFDFDRQSAPENTTGTLCTRVLDADKDLDVSVLALEAATIIPGKGRRSVLMLATKAPGERDDVYVIHHPAGLAKKVSLGCAVFPSGPDLVEHTCSTAGGSSGAPIIGADGTVVALHFAGAFPETMTVQEIQDELATGTVFRNRSKPIATLRDRLKPFLP
jgi:hypothetical protein